MEQNKCWLCGSAHDNIAFKGGFVCEKCIEYVKSKAGEVKESEEQQTEENKEER